MSFQYLNIAKQFALLNNSVYEIFYSNSH